MAARRPSLHVGAPAPEPQPGHLRRHRVELADGARTTVHVARHDPRRAPVRVVRLGRATALERWCRANGVAEAVVGGFFVRPDGLPLGKLRTRGIAQPTLPFTAPWDAVRACVHVDGAHVTIVRRDELPAEPRGDLLQAGPLLVRRGAPCADGDPEGFSAGAAQFDSDITDGRHPRAALGLTADRLYAVACDGRSRHDAGLTLEELAALMAALDCAGAVNLDGGGSTSLVSGGRLRNRPRKAYELPEPGGRPVSTALLFLPRG